MNTTSLSSDLLTRREAAEYLRVKPQTLALWACTGRYGLRFVKVGGRVYYRRSDLDRFLEQRTATQVGQLRDA